MKKLLFILSICSLVLTSCGNSGKTSAKTSETTQCSHKHSTCDKEKQSKKCHHNHNNAEDNAAQIEKTSRTCCSKEKKTNCNGCTQQQ